MHFTSYKREAPVQKDFNICVVIFVIYKQSFIKSYDLMKLLSVIYTVWKSFITIPSPLALTAS
jgi:hypothetical protein